MDRRVEVDTKPGLAADVANYGRQCDFTEVVPCAINGQEPVEIPIRELLA